MKNLRSKTQKIMAKPQRLSARILSVLFWLVSISLIFSPGITLATPASDLSNLLAHFSTYQADFKQWVVNDKQQLQSQSTGTFEIKRPNKFRWVTNAPSKTLIIADGNTLWHYDATLQEATKQILRPGSLAQNPAMLLSSNVEHFSTHFTVYSVMLMGEKWFLLTPKTTQNYKKIYLYFHQNTLTKIMVINNLDDRSLFQFSNIVQNHAIPDTNFIFKAPKGVDVDVQN